MSPLAILFAIAAAYAVIMLAWTYTPRGKRWLKDL